MLDEEFVETKIRNYLIKKGWKLTNTQKEKNEHGVDVKCYHPKWRRTMLIETKGSSKSKPNQAKHNAFYNILGQILSRMDKEGNKPKRAKIYAIGIPKTWEGTFKNKIKNMKYGWSLLKLKIFLVDDDGNVEEKPWRKFLI